MQLSKLGLDALKGALEDKKKEYENHKKLDKTPDHKKIFELESKVAYQEGRLQGAQDFGSEASIKKQSVQLSKLKKQLAVLKKAEKDFLNYDMDKEDALYDEVLILERDVSSIFGVR